MPMVTTGDPSWLGLSSMESSSSGQGMATALEPRTPSWGNHRDIVGKSLGNHELFGDHHNGFWENLEESWNMFVWENIRNHGLWIIWPKCIRGSKRKETLQPILESPLVALFGRFFCFWSAWVVPKPRNLLNFHKPGFGSILNSLVVRSSFE